MTDRQTGFRSFAHVMVRVCLVLLVLTGPAPLQFVLCQEYGQLPRLEQAVNGQCISSSREACSDCSSIERHEQSGQQQLGSTHRHCSSCQDRALHSSPTNRLAKAQVAAVHHWLGGCLYSFAAGSPGQAPAWTILALDRQDGSPPTAAELIAESTCLLI